MRNSETERMDRGQNLQGTLGEQMSLFEGRNILINKGISELTRLNLDAAKKAFQEYAKLYHNPDNIDKELKLTDFLMEGFRQAPENGPERPVYLFGLWQSFTIHLRAVGYRSENIIADIKYSFFKMILDALDRGGTAEPLYVSDSVPVGYVYIQTGQYDLAVKSLQACIPATPGNAVIYGYLGDVYVLRGEPDVARRCYLEGCLIDPVGIDWGHMKDRALLELKEQLTKQYSPGDSLALEWLPSYAYLQTLFKPKTMKLNEGLREFVDEYLNLKKAYRKEQRPDLKAKLFLRSIILCDNEYFLRFIKKVDFAGIRGQMKEMNPNLFSRYLKYIEGRSKHEG